MPLQLMLPLAAHVQDVLPDFERLHIPLDLGRPVRVLSELDQIIHTGLTLRVA